MKVLRSTCVAAVAIFAAACGDKVTVAGPIAPVAPVVTAAAVTAVAVAPATATMSVNETVSFTAAVTAVGGAAATVTWSSSDAAKVSVNATGVATAVAATPGVAVCATSTVTATAKGCASVVVTAATAAIPATVSIQSITVTGTNNVTVVPTAVVGGIDITLNVSPGNQSVSKIVLTVGGVRVDSQTFTAAQAASLRFAADQAAETQTTFPQILFSVNTAAFNATTGVPRYLNGAQSMSAQLYTKQGGTAAAATANAASSLTFANVNTTAATTTVGGTTATANSAAGFRYAKGDLTVSLLPVSYNGVAFASGTVNFGTAACDLSLVAQRTKVLTAPATGSSAWTAVFVNSGAAGAANLRNYEYGVGACPGANSLGEQFTIVAAQDGSGNPFTTTALPIAVGSGYRIDNRAPAAPGMSANPNGRLNGWLNDAAQFTTIQAAGNLNGMITAAIVDGGVGGVTYAAKAGDYAAVTIDVAAAAADVTTPASLSATISNASLCVIGYSVDALGNRSAAPAAASACAASTQSTIIGVDRAAPTIAPSGGLASSARINSATVAGNFQVTVSDTGIVGNSGMNSASSVMGTVTLRDATPTTGAGACLVGVYAAATGCTAASVNAAPTFPLVPTGAAVSGFAGPGYLTYTAQARDAAGNLSAAVTRTVVHDDVATPPAVTFATPFLPNSINAAAASVSAVVSDNLDIRDYQWTFTYGATMGGFPIERPAVTVNAFNATPLINNTYSASFSGALTRQVQENGGAGTWTPGGATVLSSANVIVRDQGGSAGTTVSTAIPGGTVSFATAATDYATVAGTPSNWNVSNAATNVSDGAAAVVANALSVTLTADAEGATALFNSPFTRVDFYALNTGGTRWVLIGSVATPVTTDNGVLRRHRYSFAWTPGTTFGLGAKSIRAIGVNAAGDGMSTVTSANITVTNP